jgi:hypothetical protein
MFEKSMVTKRPVAVTDAKDRNLHAFRQQIPCHAERFQDLHGSSMNHAGTRSVGAGRLPINDQRGHAAPAQLSRQCKTRWPRAGYEDLSFSFNVLHAGLAICLGVFHRCTFVALLPANYQTAI